MKKPVFLLACCCLLLSCAKKAPQAAESPTRHISGEDEGLNQISREARESFPEFARKMSDPGPDEGDFRVKYPFQAEPGSAFGYEHIWLEDIFFEDGRYYGTLSNRPYYISSLQAGDVVPFEAELISDWMYIKAGQIVGGCSVKYLIKQIPEPGWDEGTRILYRRFAPD
ncbi:MAG: DUF2314 domain-containing protein [Treponema sp.]|jgi:uncharacterized protein YegJ (DUF2314 family)|nr:DUF2314 domain-containing protein [Treponema sp.]